MYADQAEIEAGLNRVPLQMLVSESWSKDPVLWRPIQGAPRACSACREYHIDVVTVIFAASKNRATECMVVRGTARKSGNLSSACRYAAYGR